MAVPLRWRNRPPLAAGQRNGTGHSSGTPDARSDFRITIQLRRTLQETGGAPLARVEREGAVASVRVYPIWIEADSRDVQIEPN